MPDDPFRRFWNILMIVLLIYVVTYVPISICFVDGASDEVNAGQILDMAVDIFFAMDLIMAFISAYEDPVTGHTVVSLKAIACNYLSGWFIIDFVAVFPTQEIEKALKGDETA